MARPQADGGVRKGEGMNRSCMNCRFCGMVKNVDGTLMHSCRRRPPVLAQQAIPVGGGQLGWVTSTAWPIVTDRDWRGDFEPELKLAS